MKGAVTMHKNQAMYNAAVFAALARKTGTCGDDAAASAVWKYILEDSPENESEAREALRSFVNLYSNLQTIAEIYGIEDPFDPMIIEAYIYGNELSDGSDVSNIAILTKHLAKAKTGLIISKKTYQQNELTEKIVANIAKLAEGMNKTILIPEQYLPTVYTPLHLGYVLISALAASTPLSDSVIAGGNLCMTKWGKVSDIGSTAEGYTQVSVDSVNLAVENGKYVIVDAKLTVELDSRLGLSLKVGDIVATHRGLILGILSPERAKNLHKYTQMTLDAFNA